MLLFALGVVLFAYAAVGLGLKGKLPPGLPVDIIVFAVAHARRRIWRSAGSRRTPTRCCCRWPRC